jgi:TatD DNase family protein
VLSLYDAHNHFHDDWLASSRADIDRTLRAIGLRRAVVNGTCEQDWPVVASLAREYGWILPSYGLHPWDCGNRSPGWQKLLCAQLEAEPGAAVGEIGLDRWILERARPDDARLAGLRRAPLDEQIEVFAWQLELAATLVRPASIHCLDAFGALLETLTRTRRPVPGFLLHAYGGPVEMVKKFADLGAYFSFNGSFLDDRHAAKQEVFRHIPADRLLVETDAPAMPLPHQWATHRLPPAPGGQTINHPANLEATYAGLASLRGISVEELALLVETNFLRLFGAQAPWN